MRNEVVGSVALMIALAVPVGGCSSSSTVNPAGSGGSLGSAGTQSGTGGSSTATGGGGGTGGSGTGGSGTGGSGGSGGSGTVTVTTLAGTKAFKDLTEGEITQLCNDTFAYFGLSISSADRCKWAGLQASASSSPESDAMMQMACATHENLCKTADGSMHASCFGSIDASCTATVAQYSACLADETAGFSGTVKGFPVCSAVKISDVSLIMTTESSTPPASCMTFTNACNTVDVPNPLTL